MPRITHVHGPLIGIVFPSILSAHIRHNTDSNRSSAANPPPSNPPAASHCPAIPSFLPALPYSSFNQDPPADTGKPRVPAPDIFRRHGPFSNACRAAMTALSTRSALSPSATLRDHFPRRRVQRLKRLPACRVLPNAVDQHPGLPNLHRQFRRLPLPVFSCFLIFRACGRMVDVVVMDRSSRNRSERNEMVASSAFWNDTPLPPPQKSIPKFPLFPAISYASSGPDAPIGQSRRFNAPPIRPPNTYTKATPPLSPPALPPPHFSSIRTLPRVS